ncbi:MAG: hypothetical protein PWP08_931 [Methanofollis sp.]|nr:hypothetical protein [Methanofollis sp.]
MRIDGVQGRLYPIDQMVYAMVFQISLILRLECFQTSARLPPPLQNRFVSYYIIGHLFFSMERLHLAILAAGVIIGGGIAVTGQVFMGLSVFIVLATVAMSLHIMNDTKNLPDIGCRLAEDARSIVIRNTGNARAEQIHVALVPMNVEFDIPTLGIEEEYVHSLSSMIEEVKVVVTYKNSEGRKFGGSYKLSSLGEEIDLLKPTFPLFSWK